MGRSGTTREHGIGRGNPWDIPLKGAWTGRTDLLPDKSGPQNNIPSDAEPAARPRQRLAEELPHNSPVATLLPAAHARPLRAPSAAGEQSDQVAMAAALAATVLAAREDLPPQLVQETLLAAGLPAIGEVDTSVAAARPREMLPPLRAAQLATRLRRWQTVVDTCAAATSVPVGIRKTEHSEETCLPIPPQETPSASNVLLCSSFLPQVCPASVAC